ncbi:hypothetical protein CDL15_Pgr013127 [Punica granatum]|uniref:Uncharacterized protein n=1 Tax=Punica granatum TaxID=22663 RepID=A0A218WE32_PUNGR|nr:hypothetical protein CDL15_Pgr013127 [Punica granatum]
MFDELGYWAELGRVGRDELAVWPRRSGLGCAGLGRWWTGLSSDRAGPLDAGWTGLDRCYLGAIGELEVGLGAEGAKNCGRESRAEGVGRSEGAWELSSGSTQPGLELREYGVSTSSVVFEGLN